MISQHTSRRLLRRLAVTLCLVGFAFTGMACGDKETSTPAPKPSTECASDLSVTPEKPAMGMPFMVEGVAEKPGIESVFITIDGEKQPLVHAYDSENEAVAAISPLDPAMSDPLETTVTIETDAEVCQVALNLAPLPEADPAIVDRTVDELDKLSETMLVDQDRQDLMDKDPEEMTQREKMLRGMIFMLDDPDNPNSLKKILAGTARDIQLTKERKKVVAAVLQRAQFDKALAEYNRRIREFYTPTGTGSLFGFCNSNPWEIAQKKELQCWFEHQKNAQRVSEILTGPVLTVVSGLLGIFTVATKGLGAHIAGTAGAIYGVTAFATSIFEDILPHKFAKLDDGQELDFIIERKVLEFDRKDPVAWRKVEAVAVGKPHQIGLVDAVSLALSALGSIASKFKYLDDFYRPEVFRNADDLDSDHWEKFADLLDSGDVPPNFAEEVAISIFQKRARQAKKAVDDMVTLIAELLNLEKTVTQGEGTALPIWTLEPYRTKRIDVTEDTDADRESEVIKTRLPPEQRGYRPADFNMADGPPSKPTQDLTLRLDASKYSGHEAKGVETIEVPCPKVDIVGQAVCPGETVRVHASVEHAIDKGALDWSANFGSVVETGEDMFGGWAKVRAPKSSGTVEVEAKSTAETHISIDKCPDERISDTHEIEILPESDSKCCVGGCGEDDDPNKRDLGCFDEIDVSTIDCNLPRQKTGCGWQTSWMHEDGQPQFDCFSGDTCKYQEHTVDRESDRWTGTRSFITNKWGRKNMMWVSDPDSFILRAGPYALDGTVDDEGIVLWVNKPPKDGTYEWTFGDSVQVQYEGGSHISDHNKRLEETEDEKHRIVVKLDREGDFIRGCIAAAYTQTVPVRPDGQTEEMSWSCKTAEAQFRTHFVDPDVYRKKQMQTPPQLPKSQCLNN